MENWFFVFFTVMKRDKNELLNYIYEECRALKLLLVSQIFWKITYAIGSDPKQHIS